MRIKSHVVRALPYALALSFSIQGCGSLIKAPADKGAIPILIPVFLNDTFEPGLGGKVTRAVKQEFLSRGQFRVTQDPSRAHLVLEGTVRSFGLTPLSFNQAFQAAEYRVSISADVRILKSEGQEPLWSQGGIQGSAEFAVNPDPGIARSAQDLAINEALKRMAEEIWIQASRVPFRQPPDGTPLPAGTGALNAP